MVRWELHRVWVVEATLKTGKRHIYGKRVFYLDEDTWRALSADEYDLRGNMYRVGFAYLTQSYDVPAPLTIMTSHYDLISGHLRGQSCGRTTAASFTTRRPSDRVVHSRTRWRLAASAKGRARESRHEDRNGSSSGAGRC